MGTTISMDQLSNQTVSRNAQGQITAISGSGIFDKMLSSIASFMELQQQDSKITQSQYAELLGQSLPAILGAASDFVMKSAMTAVEIDKTKEEIQLTYVTRVIKDKEAALMGLDDVALNARRAQNGSKVYTVAYTTV